MRAWLRSECWFLVIVLMSLDLPTVDAAGHWPTWRGPHGTGVAEAGRYPTLFSHDKNLLWSIPLPSHAGSTPIVWDQQIVLTVAEQGKNWARCYDWQGKERWSTEVGSERPGKHKKASGCNSSPVTDGEHVFVYFKSGDFACLDWHGQIVWKCNLQDQFGADTLWWDLGTSPVLTRDHVVVAVVQSGPSYLVAFDKATGNVAWKVDRLLDAPEEANQTYSTPLVIDRDGRQMLVVLGADHVTAHDAANGAELWRHGGMNPKHDGYFRSIASAVCSDGVIVAPYARGQTLTALSLDGKLLWETSELGSDVPTPAAQDGKVFLCTDKGRLVCLDIRSGKTLWEAQTGKHRDAFSASPTIAGQQVYLAREDGTVFVIDLAGEHSIAASNALNDFLIATPVAVDDRLLVRTGQHLYCFGSN